MKGAAQPWKLYSELSATWPFSPSPSRQQISMHSSDILTCSLALRCHEVCIPPREKLKVLINLCCWHPLPNYQQVKCQSQSFLWFWKLHSQHACDQWSKVIKQNQRLALLLRFCFTLMDECNSRFQHSRVIKSCGPTVTLYSWFKNWKRLHGSDCHFSTLRKHAKPKKPHVLICPLRFCCSLSPNAHSRLPGCHRCHPPQSIMAATLGVDKVWFTGPAMAARQNGQPASAKSCTFTCHQGHQAVGTGGEKSRASF